MTSTLTHRPRAHLVSAWPEQPPRATRAARAAGGLSTVAIAVIVALALGGLSVLYLVQTSQVVQLGYELTHLQEQHDTLVLENSRLRYEIARYQSLDTVERIARHELGMTPVRRTVFLEVERPASTELPPVAETGPQPVSRWQRLWELVWGIGRAADESDSADASGQGTE